MQHESHLINQIEDPLQRKFLYKFKDFKELEEFASNFRSKNWELYIAMETDGAPRVKSPNNKDYAEEELINYLHNEKPSFGDREYLEINDAIGFFIAESYIRKFHPHFSR